MRRKGGKGWPPLSGKKRQSEEEKNLAVTLSVAQMGEFKENINSETVASTTKRAPERTALGGEIAKERFGREGLRPRGAPWETSGACLVKPRGKERLRRVREHSGLGIEEEAGTPEGKRFRAGDRRG